LRNELLKGGGGGQRRVAKQNRQGITGHDGKISCAGTEYGWPSGLHSVHANMDAVGVGAAVAHETATAPARPALTANTAMRVRDTASTATVGPMARATLTRCQNG
jgi:hypothetical protein